MRQSRPLAPTPIYPPLGKPYNQKADVYSLGILLFELVTQTAMSYHEVHNKITAYEDGLEYFAYTMLLGYRPDMPEYIPAPVVRLIDDMW